MVLEGRKEAKEAWNEQELCLCNSSVGGHLGSTYWEQQGRLELAQKQVYWVVLHRHPQRLSHCSKRVFVARLKVLLE